MADEPPGGQPEQAPDPKPPRRVPVAERVDLVRDMLEQGYSIAQTRAWCMSAVGKSWSVGARMAQRYIDRALEVIDSAVAQPKNRKQAQTRAMLTLFARRAYELAVDDGQKHKAAGLITSGVAALDKIARIDGSYEFDPAGAGGPSINPATPEDAIRIVAHAQAMLDLARRRGALVAAKPVPPPVIDVEGEEVDEYDDEGEAADDEADPGGTN